MAFPRHNSLRIISFCSSLGLSRGLVAALLYHDGRRCLVTALKLLITAKEGISWALDLDEQITTVINQYTEKLFNDGMHT